jgi:uncharacterized membrane protein YdjX (TVP38/TMEM64 family)
MTKRWGCIALASFVCLFYLWHPELFQQSIALIRHGDAAVLADFLRGFGLWGVIVTIALFVVMTFTIVFPFILLSGAAGIVYGIFWGIVISWLGEVIGAIIMFIFIRCCSLHASCRRPHQGSSPPSVQSAKSHGAISYWQPSLASFRR